DVMSPSTLPEPEPSSGHGLGTFGTALLSQRKNDTLPATLGCPKCTCAKRILPPVTVCPLRCEYVNTKWSVGVGALVSRVASNSPDPVVKLAGVSCKPESVAWKLCMCGSFPGPGPCPWSPWAASAYDAPPTARSIVAARTYSRLFLTVPSLWSVQTGRARD